VLVLDDEKNIRRAIEMALEQQAMRVLTAHDPAAAFRFLREHVVDVLILDIKLGEVDGIAMFKRLHAAGLAVPTLFISGNATLSQAAEAVKIGAFDFVEKPFSAERIVAAVRSCLEYSRLAERLRVVEARLGAERIVGDSPAINKLISEAQKVAGTAASVLITGESGTGKELVANAIHAQSGRREMPFVKVNCSAIPETLIEANCLGTSKAHSPVR
jgi:two-component system nitrogen regulation response regulator NtrX